LKKPKNLPSKTANCCQHCCQLSIFLLHSNKNLSGLPRKNGYGPLHSHRAHQHGRRQISVRQCAVLEESSSDSDRSRDLLSPSDQWRKRTPIKIGKDVGAAHTALIQMENGRPLQCAAKSYAAPPQSMPTYASRKRVAEAARSTLSVASRNRAGPTWLSRRRQFVPRKLQEDLFRPNLPRRHARLSS